MGSTLNMMTEGKKQK